MFRSVLLLVVLAAWAPAAPGQILNTLSGFENRPGWQGGGTALVEVSGGNTESEDYNFDLAGQWQGGPNRVRLISAYEFSSENGITSEEESRVHLRHLYRLDDWISTLVFAQYQRDPFQDLRRRMLWGGGFRFEVHDQPPNRLGVGVSAMYEVDRLTTGGRSGVVRLSSFLDFRREIDDHVRSALVVFYQPKFDDFSDTRASAIADLEVDLRGPFKLLVQASLDYDTEPPADVDELDWDLSTGLRFSI